MYFFHYWLPKVHVEAPVGGSIFLAGVIIKVGGVGLCLVRGSILFLFNICFSFFVSVCLCGFIYLGYCSFFAKDLKKIIAFSSIIHIALGVGVFFIIKPLSYPAIFILFFCHGIVSPLMFKYADFLRKEIGTRVTELLKGTTTFSQFLIWFLIVIWNIGVPPRINTLVEILLYYIVLSLHLCVVFLLLIGGILISRYSLRLIMCTFGQKVIFSSNNIFSFADYIFFSFYLIILNVFLLFCFSF